jgi:hypothetical protein
MKIFDTFFGRRGRMQRERRGRNVVQLAIGNLRRFMKWYKKTD